MQALTLLRDHWRGVLVVAAISLGLGLVAGAVAAWKLKPDTPGDAEFIEVPVPDTKAEDALKAEVTALQKQLGEAKSASTSSATYTMPGGGQIHLQCEAQAEAVEVSEAAQVQMVTHFSTVEVKPAALKLSAPVKQKDWGASVAVGAGLDLKPRFTVEGDRYIGNLFGLDLKLGAYARVPVDTPIEAGVVLRTEW